MSHSGSRAERVERHVSKTLERLVGSGARVLDAACGEGRLVRDLRARGIEAWGVDIAPPQLGGASVAADLSLPLPFPDGSFDCIACVEGIEHLENPYAFLREVRRLLRPGGVFVLTTPNIAGLRSRVRFAGSGFFHGDPRPLDESRRHRLHHIGLRTIQQLRYDLHTSGFRIESVGRSHVRLVSYLYSVLVPWMYLYTWIAFRKEKDAAQKGRNADIHRMLFSPAVLFGENLVVLARKI